MLWLQTDDEILYKYRRKIMSKMQWVMIQLQWVPVAGAGALYLLTRRLKTYKPSDPFIYFLVPYFYINYGIFNSEQRRVFESGYPAHPHIQKWRADTINQTCFKFPPILKNEIEYLHSKIHPLPEEPTDEDLLQTRYEKTFRTGKVQLDYERVLNDQMKLKPKKGVDTGKRYTVIVEGGQIYLQCIDPFEEVFEISRDMIEGVELTTMLDPFLFDNHKDVTNALFEVYYDLSNEYIEKCGDPKHKTIKQ